MPTQTTLRQSLSNIYQGLKVLPQRILHPQTQTTTTTISEVPAKKIGGVTNVDYTGSTAETLGGASETRYTNPSGEVTKTVVERGGTSYTFQGTPTAEQLRASGITQLEKEATQVAKKTEEQARQQQTYYQNLINQGKMTYEEASKQYQNVISSYNRELVNKANERLRQQMEQRNIVPPPEQQIPKTLKETRERITPLDIASGFWILKGASNISDILGVGSNAPTVEQIVKGERFSIWQPTFYPAAKITQTKGFQNLMIKVAPALLKVYEKTPKFIKTTATTLSPIITPEIVGKSLFSATRGISLGTFFSPLMKTGTYQEEQLLIKKKLAENRFKELQAKYENIEKNVAEKSSTKEQVKYLRTLYDRLIKEGATEIQKQGFRDFIQKLINKQIIKLPTFVPSNQPIIVPNQFEVLKPQNEIIIDINRLPVELKGAGLTTGILGTDITKELDKTLGITKQTTIPTLSLMTILGLEKVSASKIGGGSMNKQTTTSSSQLQTPITTQIPSLTLKSSQINLQPQKSISLTTTIQPQLSLQTQIQKLNQRELEKQIQITDLTFGKGGFKLGKPSSIFLTKEEKKRRKGLFETFIKRRGKNISLGKFGNIGLAKSKLVGSLKGTLAASGFITSAGKPIPFKELKLGYEFTPSKIESFRAVQRRGFRLSTRGEVSEILSSKKAKGRKIKWL